VTVPALARGGVNGPERSAKIRPQMKASQARKRGQTRKPVILITAPGDRYHGQIHDGV